MELAIPILFYTALWSIPVWLILRQLKISYWWDYGIVFYAVIIWMLLGGYFEIGGQSLTNVALEYGCILLFSIFITLTRFLLYKFANIKFNKTVSVICIMLVIGFAILLRLIMPTLPE